MTVVIVGLTFLLSQVFIFLPLETFLNNATEFYPTSVWDILLTGITITAASLIPAILLGRLISIKYRTLVITIIVAIGYTTWLISQFLPTRSFIFNGTMPLPYTKQEIAKYDLITLAFFLATLYLLYRHSRLLKYMSSVGLLVFVINGTLIMTEKKQMPINNEGEISYWKADYIADNKDQTSFSKANSNILLLVVDTLQSDIVGELLTTHPEIFEEYTGFTFYRDAVGGFATTHTSIPLILTGKYYRNDTNLRQFIFDNMSNDSIPSILKKKGYNVFLPLNGFVNGNENTATNYIKKKGVMFLPSNQLEDVLTVALYRISPYSLKSLFVDRYYRNPRGKASHQNDYKLIDAVVNRMITTSNKPTFKLFHLNGIHPPPEIQTVDKLGSWSWDNAVHTAGNKLAYIAKLLTTIKKYGIYDNTMLVITADHVAGLSKSKEANENYLPLEFAYGRPALLIKPFNADFGGINISDKEVSLQDIRATILSEVGVNDTTYTYNIVNDDVPVKRKRYYYFWGYHYLRELQVAGKSESPLNWHYTGTVMTESGEVSVRPVEYGQALNFEVAGTDHYYTYLSWLGPQEGGTWLYDYTGSIYIPLTSKPKCDLEISMELTPNLAPPSVNYQDVLLYINGNYITTWSVDSRAIFKAKIPKLLANEGVLNIRMDVPNAFQPFTKVIGTEETRYLGVQMRTLQIACIGKI